MRSGIPSVNASPTHLTVSDPILRARVKRAPECIPTRRYTAPWPPKGNSCHLERFGLQAKNPPFSRHDHYPVFGPLQGGTGDRRPWTPGSAMLTRVSRRRRRFERPGRTEERHRAIRTQRPARSNGNNLLHLRLQQLCRKPLFLSPKTPSSTSSQLGFDHFSPNIEQVYKLARLPLPHTDRLADVNPPHLPRKNH